MLEFSQGYENTSACAVLSATLCSFWVVKPLTTNKGRKIDALLSDKTLAFISKGVYNGNYKLLRRKERKNMKTVNMGSKYTHRVTLRLNDEQYEFLIKVSELLGVSPSDYIRMVVNSGMISTQGQVDQAYQGKNMKGMVGTNENVKTDSNDII